jgi:hypothetical protein
LLDTSDTKPEMADSSKESMTSGGMSFDSIGEPGSFGVAIKPKMPWGETAIRCDTRELLVRSMFRDG